MILELLQMTIERPSLQDVVCNQVCTCAFENWRANMLHFLLVAQISAFVKQMNVLVGGHEALCIVEARTVMQYEISSLMTSATPAGFNEKQVCGSLLRSV